MALASGFKRLHARQAQQYLKARLADWAAQAPGLASHAQQPLRDTMLRWLRRGDRDSPQALAQLEQVLKEVCESSVSFAAVQAFGD